MKRFFRNLGVFISVVLSIIFVLFLVGYCIFQFSIMGKDAFDKHIISRFKNHEQTQEIKTFPKSDTIKTIICNYPIKYTEDNLQNKVLTNLKLPLDTIALQIFQKLKQSNNAKDIEIKKIISSNRILLAKNKSEECLLACYQSDRMSWIVFLASCCGDYQMFMYQDDNIIGLPLDQFFKFYPNQITFYDGYFKYSSDGFYGNLYYYYKNRLVQLESLDYCLYAFKSQKMKNVLGKESSFVIIRSLDLSQNNSQDNSIVELNNPTIGLCLKKENSFAVAKVGEPIKNVIKYPLVTYFSKCDNSLEKTFKNGILYVTRNVFINKEERLAGYAQFTADNENAKIKTIKLFVKHF